MSRFFRSPWRLSFLRSRGTNHQASIRTLDDLIVGGRCTLRSVGVGCCNLVIDLFLRRVRRCNAFTRTRFLRPITNGISRLGPNRGPYSYLQTSRYPAQGLSHLILLEGGGAPDIVQRQTTHWARALGAPDDGGLAGPRLRGGRESERLRPNARCVHPEAGTGGAKGLSADHPQNERSARPLGARRRLANGNDS